MGGVLFLVASVYKHQRQNAEAAKPDRFSDLISDSDSSEDSTVRRTVTKLEWI